MFFRVLYEKGDEKYEVLCCVPYDQKLGFFLKDFCDEIEFDFDKCVFFWWPVGLPVKALLCNETPEETGMEIDETYTVDFFLPHLYPDVPENPVLVESETPENPVLVEYSGDDYNKEYRKRSGLGYWSSTAWLPAFQGTFTPHDMGVDPDEVY